MSRTILLALAGLTLTPACRTPDPGPAPEAISLLGEDLHPPALPAERRAALEADLAAAQERFRAQDGDEESTLWLGRRLAYLGRYRAALEVFGAGLERFPNSYRLLRHRGHRRITVRELEPAIADLERARELARDLPDEVEPDGAPNEFGIPRSTTRGNIAYHLALARYLTLDLTGAAEAWDEGLELATNDDSRCSAAYWRYLSLRRLERDEEAARLLATIEPDMEILENHAYHRLLLHYRGELGEDELFEGVEPDSVEAATLGYGLGAEALLEEREEEADARFLAIVEATPWAAFGHLAAEAELARRRPEVEGGLRLRTGSGGTGAGIRLRGDT